MKKVISDIGIVVTGNTPSKKNKEYYNSKDIRFFKPSDMNDYSITNLNLSEEFLSEKARKKARILPKDTILVTCIGNIGKVGILQVESACNQQINAIIPNINMNSRYIAYLISSKKEYMQSKANAPVVPIMNKTDFSKIEIEVVEKEEQDEIVNKLDAVSEIIDIRKKQINELDKLINSKFIEMFGNLKINDKNWRKVEKISNVCILNPSKSELSNVNNIEVSLIPMRAVSENGKINTSRCKLLSDVKSGFTYFAEDDVLFAKITPCMENGKGAVATGLINNIGFGSTEFHVLRPTGLINSIWLYTLTSMHVFRKEAEMHMTGSAGQKRVPIKFFEDYKIGIPPIELQNQFAVIVRQINNQKNEIENSLKETKKLLNSLMDKYFLEAN